VDEVVVVDGATHTVHWFALDGSAYGEVSASPLLGTDVSAVASSLDW
jgi:hypothetical protein